MTTPSPRSSRRTTVLAGLAVAVVVGLAALAVALSGLVQSPGEAAARSRAPELTPIAVPVQRTVLRDTVTVYGVVSAARSFDVVIRGFDLPRAEALVTATPLGRGDRVRFGASMIEVAGRPVIAVPGPVPMYRDIVPGDRGADVAQVQAGLRAAGYRVDDPREVYGPSTDAALQALYRRLGYPAPVDATAAETGGGSPASSAATPSAGPSAAPSTRGDSPDSAPSASVVIRRSEFVAVPNDGMRVATVVAHIGAEAEGPLVRLVGGRTVLRADLAPGEAALVRVGARAVTTVEGKEVTGRVSALRDQAASADGSTPAATVATITLDRALGLARDDEELRVDLVVATTKSKVLVVPSSTIRADTSGVTTVMLASDRRRVPVRTGLVAGGLVEIEPTSGSLRAGDEVLVGVH